jgi:hypothetical protein
MRKVQGARIVGYLLKIEKHKAEILGASHEQENPYR